MNKNLRALHNYLNTLGTKAKAVTFGGVASLMAPAAFAQTTGGGIDTGDIVAAIAAMGAAGVVIYTAYAVGKWTLKAFGLIGK